MPLEAIENGKPILNLRERASAPQVTTTIGTFCIHADEVLGGWEITGVIPKGYPDAVTQISIRLNPANTEAVIEGRNGNSVEFHYTEPVNRVIAWLRNNVRIAS